VSNYESDELKIEPKLLVPVLKKVRLILAMSAGLKVYYSHSRFPVRTSFGSNDYKVYAKATFNGKNEHRSIAMGGILSHKYGVKNTLVCLLKKRM
jgi:hypothetical protein